MDRDIDGQMDGWMDEQIDRQMDRWIDRWIERRRDVCKTNLYNKPLHYNQHYRSFDQYDFCGRTDPSTDRHHRVVKGDQRDETVGQNDQSKEGTEENTALTPDKLADNFSQDLGSACGSFSQWVTSSWLTFLSGNFETKEQQRVDLCKYSGSLSKNYVKSRTFIYLPQVA